MILNISNGISLNDIILTIFVVETQYRPVRYKQACDYIT